MNAIPPLVTVLLADLASHGIEMRAVGDRLRHRPADLPLDLSARLRLQKTAVLGLLRDPLALDPEAEFILDERLAMADELDLLTEPGKPSWLIAMGEAILDQEYRLAIRQAS